MTDTANASPRPWRVTDYETGPQDIYAANGFRVCTMGITTSSDADAALIVDAVNNYKAKSEKRHPDTEDEFDPTALKSYRRPWSVSIDDENCLAVIRDADGLDVAYISDVIRSRAGDAAKMFVGLVEEGDRLRKSLASMMRVAYAERQKAEMFKRQWEKATGSEFAKKLSAARYERDKLRDIVRRLADTADDYASLLLSTGERDAGVMDLVTGLVAEARAAVGEDR